MKNIVETLGAFIYKIHKPEVISLTCDLADRQWWTKERLYEFSDNRTGELVEYAVRKVPYYKKIFDSKNININKTNYNDYWDKIPILEKDTLRFKYNELKGDEVYLQSAIQNASGGSTGKPVKFISDLSLFKYTSAFLNLIFTWAGWNYGETILYIWGTKKQILPLSRSEKFKYYIKRQIELSALSYDEAVFSQWGQIIKTYKPRIIYGYPSVIAIFAKWLKKKGIVIKNIKGVFCSAETLIDEQRKIIGEIFNCKVFNQYGSRETPAVACECEKGNLHLFIDINRIEFIKSSDKSDNEKKIVITPLYNYAQPLLRYDTGDYGKAKDQECPCGRGYPLMDNIVGRQNDHLISRNGKKIYASFFHHLLDEKDWIRSFQFQQKEIGKILLKVETERVEDLNIKIKNLKNELSKKINTVMSENLLLDINVVNKIHRTIAGKHRFVINELEL